METKIEESTGKMWYQDSGGKQSPKRIFGVIVVIHALIFSWMKALHFVEADIDWSTILTMLGIGLGALGIGGITKGG